RRQESSRLYRGDDSGIDVSVWTFCLRLAALPMESIRLPYRRSQEEKGTAGGTRTAIDSRKRTPAESATHRFHSAARSGNRGARGRTTRNLKCRCAIGSCAGGATRTSTAASGPCRKEITRSGTWRNREKPKRKGVTKHGVSRSSSVPWCYGLL